jgi:hypothetical protein
MKKNSIYQIVVRTYDVVESALWTLLAASVFYFGVFVLPKVPTIRAQIVDARAKEIAAQQAYYCDRLGMPTATLKYSECLLVLGEFRKKVEQQVDQEYDF